MRNRTILYFLTGLLLAVVLVGAATNLAASGSKPSRSWAFVQRHNPLLWMVDGCAVIILLGAGLYGAALNGQAGDASSRRLEMLTDSVENLIAQNREHEARVIALEDSGEAWHEGFETEARRLTARAFEALSDNIEANAMQLDAINLALRYQRAETKTIRLALQGGDLEPEGNSPPPLEAMERPARASLPEWKESETATELAPEPDQEPEEEYKSIEIADVDEQPAARNGSETDEVKIEEEDAEEPTGEPIIENKDGESDSGGTQDPTVDEDNAIVEVETKPDAEAVEDTINANTTIVRTLVFDAAADTELEEDVLYRESTSAKDSMAASEFRRSKRDLGSIFRQKRER